MVDDKKNVGEMDETVLQSEEELKGGTRPLPKAPYLILVEGPRQGIRFPISGGDNAIGRAMGSEVLLEDQSVSRRHSIVTGSRDGWAVEDKDSKNGTFVNGKRITEKVTIGHGDIIQVGIYSLRLITRDVPPEEEVMPFPADWEGKTVMMGVEHEDETATMAEKPEKGRSEEEKIENMLADISPGEVPKDMVVPEGLEESKVKKPSLFRKILLIVLLVLVVSFGVGYAYFKFIRKASVKPVPIKPAIEKIEKIPTERPGEEGAPADGTTPAEAEKSAPIGPLEPQIPVFLDFASSPLPARVTFQGKDYGTTPVKVQVKLDVDTSFVTEAVFDLKEIGETYKEKVTFTVKRDEPLIPILFKGPIGVLKVEELPRDVELYLEGYFNYDPFNAKTAKMAEVVFNKPIYMPFGKYVIELRQAKELAGSGEFVKDIRYKREILMSEDNPVFVLKVAEKDLEEFPVEILSIPTNADVFMDAVKVGKTPYKGIFPLGEHTMALRKDGYFEHKQEFKIDMNIMFKTEIELKTTVAGEFINTGKHLMQKGQFKEAISKMTEVFKHSPTTGEIAQSRYLLGSCFVHLEDLSTAEGYFKESVEDEDMKYPSMLGLVTVYHGLGRRTEAIPLLIEVLMNAKDEVVKREAQALFQQISPLKSIMYIHTDPEGATVYMNDQQVEELTPLILPDLSLGNYRIHIAKDGYQPQDLSINMSVTEFNPVMVKLKPIPE